MISPHRFSSTLDECIHITIALFISNIYEMQKQELIDNYGKDITEKALKKVTSEFATLLARF